MEKQENLDTRIKYLDIELKRLHIEIAIKRLHSLEVDRKNDDYDRELRRSTYSLQFLSLIGLCLLAANAVVAIVDRIKETLP